MPEQSWDAAISVNLTAAMAITERIQRHQLLHTNGHIVCLSSVSGIAGNRGQSNYAAAKSGLIGHVQAVPRWAACGCGRNRQLALQPGVGWLKRQCGAGLRAVFTGRLAPAIIIAHKKRAASMRLPVFQIWWVVLPPHRLPK
nr:SDR family NAD(P)-dependent oxidoreductase [Marinobacter gelidimuriae]